MRRRAPSPSLPAAAGAPPVPLPRSVTEMIGLVVHHREPGRYALLYQLVWRVLNGERELLEVASDPLVHRLDLMARDIAASATLIRSAPQRVTRMIEQEATMPAKRKPEAALEAMRDREPRTLEELNAIIREAGPLVPGATQAVIGEGPAHADIVFVGEQPGDQEDLQGRPFVGPAGKLLDASHAGGRDRARGSLSHECGEALQVRAARTERRIHAKPTAGEVKHYRPWLVKELELVRPKLVVALGATALLALTGQQTPITRARGRAELAASTATSPFTPPTCFGCPTRRRSGRPIEDFVTDLERIRDLARADKRTGELPLAAE